MQKMLVKFTLLSAAVLLAFSHFYVLTFAQATSCTINLYWIVAGTVRDATQALPSGGNTVTPGTTYQAKVKFTNCNTPAGNTGYLRITKPDGVSNIPVAITTSPQTLDGSVTFSQTGEYGLSASVNNAIGDPLKDGAATVPITVTAVSSTPTPTPTGGATPTPTPDPNVGGTVGTITNPISYQSLGALIVGVIKFLMTMLGALAVLFIIIGAVRMVASAGNETAVKAGKSTVTWAVIGLAVALLSFSFISLLQSVLGRN